MAPVFNDDGMGDGEVVPVMIEAIVVVSLHKQLCRIIRLVQPEDKCLIAIVPLPATARLPFHSAVKADDAFL